MRRPHVIYTVLAFLVTFSSTVHAQTTFTPLGDFPGGTFSSEARAISRDGSTVVGTGTPAAGPREAFLWRGGELIPLGDLPGGEYRSEAFDVSVVGTEAVVVGRSYGPNEEAFRRSEAPAEIQRLGFLPGGSNSRARGVSADGGMVVGLSTGTAGYQAFRWTKEDGMSLLPGLLAGASSSGEAWDISADGKVIVGQGVTVAGADGSGFRWTADGAITIPSLPGADTLSNAYGVSSDGSVVVGQSSQDMGLEAYRWTAETGTVGLGELEGGLFRSVARATSADGSVIVGQGLSGNGDEAFVWTVDAGMRPLADVLTEAGVDLEGWILRDATDVSDDGTKIVGFGKNPAGATEAWVVRLPDSSMGVDHFKVYDIRDKVMKAATVFLKGQFDEKPLETKVSAMTQFATPVRKNRETLHDPHAHLLFFKIERSEEPRRRVSLRNQFGEQTVTTKEARWLLVPSEKVEEGSALSKMLDHYKVYVIERTPAVNAKALLLEDQFIDETVNRGAMMFFAVPVEKEHNGVTTMIQDPTVHLAIYVIRDTKNVEKSRPVKNQFGDFELNIFQGRYLCVPSEKLHRELLTD